MRYRRRKRKNAYLRKYFLTVSFLVGIFLFVSTTVMFLYFNINASPQYDPQKQTLLEQQANIQFLNNNNSDSLVIVSESEATTEIFAEAITETFTESTTENVIDTIDVPRKTNVLIVGVDKNESLTDVIIVASFDAVTKKVSLLSIPRDTYVVLEKDKLKKLKGAPSVLKINSINVYGGKNYGIEILEKEVEELLGIKLDYYVKVNLKGFRSIVDTIGGVEFKVENRLYYNDPTQNLYINIYPGLQVLDGKTAEGLVRYRKGYATQDIQRMQVQQEFLKQFAKQLMKKETIKSNFVGLVSDFLKYVDTDFGITDITKYAKYVNEINCDNIKNDTLPGEAETIDGISYYVHDKYETAKLVQEFFFNMDTEQDNDLEDEQD